MPEFEELAGMRHVRIGLNFIAKIRSTLVPCDAVNLVVI
jgi:hypothetical protein